MNVLSDLLAEKMVTWRKEIATLKKDGGDRVVSEVSIAQILGGLRGATALLCDTSVVDPEKGLFIRDYPVAELADCEPEAVFFLLCSGELPDQSALAELRTAFSLQYRLPDHLWQTLRSAADKTSMMALMSMGVLGLQAESSFHRQYGGALAKDEMWRPILADALNLIAKLPTLAAGLYRLCVLKQDPIEPDAHLGLAENFVHMLGPEFAHPELTDIIRALMLVQSDHEGGNVCNLTCQLVNSVHADPFLAYSAGINGLAGPLHGLASQNAMRFMLQVRDTLGTGVTDDSLTAFIQAKLARGEIIPGFGHAVLRGVDPRFTILHDLGQRFCGEDKLFHLADRLFRIVPGLLKQGGKVAMPFPNVDAISGPLLNHFGFSEYQFYTVIFAMSMALGMSAQMIINRGLLIPIFRPRSITTNGLIQFMGDRS